MSITRDIKLAFLHSLGFKTVSRSNSEIQLYNDNLKTKNYSRFITIHCYDDMSWFKVNVDYYHCYESMLKSIVDYDRFILFKRKQTIKLCKRF